MFDWILGSILGIAALFLGLLWSAWSWDALRWLRLRRAGASTTGVVISQTESDAGRSTRIRFAANGSDHEFLTDGMGAVAPGDVVPVRYDPRRPRRAVYAGGAGPIAVKLVSLVLLPAAFPGVLLVTMPGAGVVQAFTVSGFLAGAALGAWLRSRPTWVVKPAKAGGPRWLVWWSDHQGDVSVLSLVIGVSVIAWISGDPPWRMPLPLFVGAGVVPYLMVRWLTRGWRELVAGVIFTLVGVIGVAIGNSRADADPQLTWQALCAAIAGLVIVGIGLYRIRPTHGNTPSSVPDRPSPPVGAARIAERRPSRTSPDQVLRPAVPAPLRPSSPSAQPRRVSPADQAPPREDSEPGH
jgi:hypothetical protein